MLGIIIGCTCLVGILILFIFLYCKQKYLDLEIKIQEASNHMDIILEKKMELLNRLITHMKKKKITGVYPDIEAYRKKKSDHYFLHNVLSDVYTELIQLVDDNEEKLTDKKSISLLDQLSDNEDDLAAVIKYFNDNATDFNFLLHHFPEALLKPFLSIKQLELFRNEKRETFEILKEK